MLMWFRDAAERSFQNEAMKRQKFEFGSCNARWMYELKALLADDSNLKPWAFQVTGRRIDT
jgi:hypothetical protein